MGSNPTPSAHSWVYSQLDRPFELPVITFEVLRCFRSVEHRFLIQEVLTGHDKLPHNLDTPPGFPAAPTGPRPEVVELTWSCRRPDESIEG